MSPVIVDLDDLAEIGRGGFGVVYQARQVSLGRLVAVKVLPDVHGDTDAFGRFTRECQALAALGGHPNIATVFGCGLTDDGAGYLSLELLPGGSLADRVFAGASSWEVVASWGVQLCGALETAHRAGITHRDIKPENVLFDGLGTPKFVDFGIAGVPGAFRTATGAVTLTLAHAAPEVVAGGRGGVPGDVYALASTLFAALAGGAAFVAAADETLVPMLARIASAPVPDLRPTGVPDAVCAAVERGMAKDPADRPASAEAFGIALQAAMAQEGVSSPAPPLLLLPGVLAPFVTGPRPAASGTGPSVPAASGSYAGESTLTGWSAPPTEALAVGGPVGEQAAAARRRVNGWALVAGLAVIALGIIAWRGLDLPAPAASGILGPTAGAAASSASTSSSPPPRPSASARATPSGPGSPSSRPTASRSPATSAAGGAAPSTSGSASSATPKPSSSAPTPAPTTPPPVTPPSVPRTVRVSGATLVARSGSTPAQVSLTASWLAPTSGPALTSYDVQWTVVGGPKAGTTTSVTWSSQTSGKVLVPAPDSGSWYRWKVRSRSGTVVSSWVTARVVTPGVVGRRAFSARASLRALGIPSSTYTQTTTDTGSVGRVLAQSLSHGRVVAPGTPIALAIGRAP